MNRTFYFVGGVVALLFVFVVQSVGLVRQHADSVASPSVAPNPPNTAAAPDATSSAIDALAAWPAAAVR